jgi:hypothetical protein
MITNRRNFIGKACLTGACFCGFTALGQVAGAKQDEATAPDPNKILMQDWIATLLLNIGNLEDEATCRKIMKGCAISHYHHLKMDDFLKPYEGNLNKFNSFIELEWGWKINYQKDTSILVADENKSYCVCPMINQEKGVKSPIHCFCSEGFAELMFSKVVGHPVTATVISSIHRGNDRCKYEIRIG